MLKVRFEANFDDYRPVKWPPPGPYWCTGFGNNYSTVVAYVENEDQIYEFWPEANNVDIFQENVLPEFTDRMPKPEWWNNDLG